MNELEIVVRVDQVRKRFESFQKSTDSEIMPVIKNNSNGLGFREIFNLYKSIGVKTVACSYANEFYLKAKEDEGINKFSWIWSPDNRYLEVKNLILACKNFTQLKFCIDNNIPYYVCFDIGMNRGGFTEKDIPNLILLGDIVQNVMYHCPHTTKEGASLYVESVKKHVENLKKYFSIEKVTAENSYVFMNSNFHFDQCRIGEALLLPRFEDKFTNGTPYNPIEIKTYIADTKTVKAGEYVGYNAVKLEKDTRIAVLPVGYYSLETDHLNYVLVNCGHFYYKEKVITSMHDTTIIDIGDLEFEKLFNAEVILMDVNLIEDNWNRCIQKTFKINSDMAAYKYL